MQHCVVFAVDLHYKHIMFKQLRKLTFIYLPGFKSNDVKSAVSPGDKDILPRVGRTTSAVSGTE